MAKYKAYPEYQSANSQWIDIIPLEWTRAALKFVVSARITDGPHETPNFIDDGVPFLSAEAIKLNKLDFSRKRAYISFNLHEKYSLKCLPQRDDIFMVKSGNTTGAVAIVETDEIFNIWSPLALIRCNKEIIAPRYVYYSMLADFFQTSVQLSWSQGTQPNIGMGVIENLHLTYPELTVQNKIVSFLDHETAKIDNLIEKQQQLIELLKEKRQAVISHAVTKGLNPDVPMKDSGVEWLGDVPEHWTVTKLGYHAIKIGSGKTPRGGSEIYLDEGILFLRSQNIYDDGLRVGSSECVFIDLKTHNEMKGTRVLEGDILLNITGGSIGRSCIVPTPFVEANVNQHVCILRFRESIREFISYAMKSSSTKEQIEACQVGGNREGLNFEQTSKINISLPPEEEIDTVLGYLKIRLSQLDTLEKNASNIILLLQERRTALISAAVTGKIDVRDWVAPGISDIEAIEEATA